jgi:ABC-type nitrate/sulfonate/bicarbonate transport system substrate-binding protein
VKNIAGRGLIAFLFGFVFAFVVGAPADAATSLTVGKAIRASSTMLPADVGAKTGIFKKHGLDVKIVNFAGGSKLHQAMVAGSVDIGVGAGPEMAFIAKGAPVRAVCEGYSAPRFIGIMVPVDSPVHRVAQLKGKKIGVSSVGSLSYWLALELARKEGWGPEGIETVAIGNGSASAIAAFKTHAIDANIIATAVIFDLEAQKVARLLIPVSKYEGNIGGGMVFATEKLIKTDPGAIRNFLAGWLDTIAFMRKNKAETIKIASEVSGFPKSVEAREYDSTIGGYSRTCKFDAESLGNLKRSFTDLKLVETPPDMAKLYTEAYLPKH